LAADLARLQAETEDDELLDAEGDFPAKLAPPSRPHRGDDEEDDEEVEVTLSTLGLYLGCLRDQPPKW